MLSCKKESDARPDIETARPEYREAEKVGSKGVGDTRTSDESSRSRAPGSPGGVTDLAGTGGGASPGPRKGQAEFKTVEGVKLDGEAELVELDTGVRISVEVEDAPPGKKGIHIHEKGDCSDIPKMSMGSHFAPHKEPHGLPGAAARHPGDLGNIEIGQDGKGKLEITAPHVNLKNGDAMTVLGRSIVIHQNEDKGTQPTGGAGTPIACAPITAAD